MKLVAAKCPNCGANLDVNPNNETMKCQYCKGAILVDDAINKYKLEIYGEIEVKNLPKVDNYLKIADRNYNLKEYDDAYKNYDKVIELAPNNKTALLRYGICKTLLNNYIDFSLEYLNNSFNEVVKLAKNDKTYEKNIESYVGEVSYAIDESLYALRKYYNSYVVNGSDLIQIQSKLISILNCYETILEHTNNKTHITKQIVSVLKDIIRDKNYKTGTSIEGGNFLETYKISAQYKNTLTKKLSYYENILNTSSGVSDEENKKDSLEIKSDLNKKIFNNVKTTTILIDVFLWMLIIGAILNNCFISMLIMIFIFLIITFDEISRNLFEGNNKKKKYFIFALVILLIITIGLGI